MEFSEVFWTSFYTASMAFLLGVGRMCYKSKCASIDCYGVHILRDVETEEDYDEKQLKEMKTTKVTHENLLRC
jgi:hypothetical protein